MKSSKRKRESATPATPEAAAAAPRPPAPNSSPTIVLASHCSVKDAAALKASLAAALDESDAVTLDVAAVERIDTATMQLLCAFVRDRAAAARPIAWSGESKALSEAARLLGAATVLALPSTGAAA